MVHTNLWVYPSQYLEHAMNFLGREFPGTEFHLVSIEELQERPKKFLKNHFRSFEKVVFLVYDLEVQRKLLLGALFSLWVSRKEAYFADTKGRIERVHYSSLFCHYIPSFLVELASVPCLLLRVRAEIGTLATESPKVFDKELFTTRGVGMAYLRTDHWFGVKSGGSVGHISGVVESFQRSGHPLFIISTDELPLVDSARIPVYVIKPKGIFRNLPELPELEYDQYLIGKATDIFEKYKPSIVYQRYSLNNYSGVILSRKYRIPFILEYNGSEVWMARHWGKPLRFESTANKIELLNLHAADLIVVVSTPMKHELVKRGITEAKILVNPNGVDAQRFRPDVDGSAVRQKYGLEEKVVIGFIGTFGKWHGSEVLAKAAAKIIKLPDTTRELHFLFIGDGVTLSETKRIVQDGKIDDRVTFTGMVPQEKGPEYLAACDILVAPHVPNPDGTPFFGSPTKLFEYMAMGRGIVASNLDQIGDVLEHGRTAWMVKPGDCDELAEGIIALAKDRTLRESLGQNAREEVLNKYTWEQHVKRTLDKLWEILEPHKPI
jgi:glycosyltransferase involved in cell wall biosynthesis